MQHGPVQVREEPHLCVYTHSLRLSAFRDHCDLFTCLYSFATACSPLHCKRLLRWGLSAPAACNAVPCGMWLRLFYAICVWACRHTELEPKAALWRVTVGAGVCTTEGGMMQQPQPINHRGGLNGKSPGSLRSASPARLGCLLITPGYAITPSLFVL